MRRWMRNTRPVTVILTVGILVVAAGWVIRQVRSVDRESIVGTWETETRNGNQSFLQFTEDGKFRLVAKDGLRKVFFYSGTYQQEDDGTVSLVAAEYWTSSNKVGPLNHDVNTTLKVRLVVEPTGTMIIRNEKLAARRRQSVRPLGHIDFTIEKFHKSSAEPEQVWTEFVKTFEDD